MSGWMKKIRHECIVEKCGEEETDMDIYALS
jgi:hypothetical protein